MLISVRKMKLKQLAEDFRVEEISKFNILKNGSYKIYLLEKKGLETFSLLSYLSRKNRIPASEFGIAGLKDRHAVTKQHFTIPSIYDIKTLNEKNFNISFLGYLDRKIGLGDLIANKFEITVRDIAKGELDGAYQKADTLAIIGVPNYFDSQRFGSVIDKEFIAKFVLKKDYESAVKIFLTKYTKFESKNVKEEKRKIAENWNSLSKVNIKNPVLAAIVNEYAKTRNWLDAYKKIPPNLREMFISAYQSYLWNECIKLLLIKAVNNKCLYSVPYNIGSLLFYKKLSEEELKIIPSAFKTISDEMELSELEKGIVSKVLSKEGISINDFSIKKATGNFFKAHERAVLVKPSDFRISSCLTDELNCKRKNNKFKITVSFSLPKGSYATVITKRIFNS